MMPDAAAMVAWLELLELPEMGGCVLLSSVLKQASRWFLSAPGSSSVINCTPSVTSCTASSLQTAHHEQNRPLHGLSDSQ
jgi:hypothetical protein